MRIVVFLYAFLSILEAGVVSVNIAPKLENNRYMNIKILDQKQLSYNELQGVKFAELSDVTYHTKTDTLYFVGDKGSLFAFRARFGKKIEHLEPLRASRLKSKKGRSLRNGKETVKD